VANGKFISYLRVSTDKQGKSGLGLEAQRQAVADYLNGGRWKLLAEFVEVESGKNDDRPQLKAALHRSEVTGAMLVVAKLDRLSRDVAFLANLQKSGVKFRCCDMPDASEFTINILAAVAQHERKLISERTKAAMAAARKRQNFKGYGNPNGAAAFLRAGAGNAAATEAVSTKANGRARKISPVIDDIRGDGITTLQGIADELNAREITTARGGRWYPTTVRNVLQRIGLSR
jgi:DNA invertase Pin-like site-specific DNA recombinase